MTAKRVAGRLLAGLMLVLPGALASGAGLPAAEAKPLPAATAGLTISLPATAFIGSSLAFDATFDNTGSSTGYGPFIDLVFPVNGADGAAGTDTPDGLSFVSATYLGASLTTVIQTFPNDGGGLGCVDHPYARDTSGAFLQVCGTTGDRLVVVLLPFGSVTPTQPPMVVSVSASMSNLADLGTPLTVHARAGFRFGETPLDDWCCDAVIVSSSNTQSSAWPSSSVTPTLITLSKTYNGPEDETATGPNYPRRYTVNVDLPAGQTVTDLDLTDSLPDNLAFTSVVAVSAGGVVTVTPTPGVASNPPDNQIVVNFASVTGTAAASDASMTFEYFVPDLDANGDAVIDPFSGASVQSQDNASAVGTWTPLDGRDSGSVGNAVANPPGPEHTLNDRSLAIQKSVGLAVDNGAPGVSPGDVLEYSLEAQVSDYFTFGDLEVTDVISDGQHFDASFTPTLDVTERGSADSGSFIVGTDLIVDTSEIGNDSNPATDGSTSLFFHLSQALTRIAGDDLLQGGRAIAPDAGPATATIVFRTIVQDNFTDTYPSGDPSVDQGDVLNDDVTATGTVRDNDATGTVLGSPSDASAASVTIERGVISKTIYAVNGSTSFSSPPEVAPGETVTYRIQASLPTSDVESLAYIDYLPLPVFLATEVTTFNDAQSATPPAAGEAQFGPNDTFRAYSGIVPSVTSDAAANSLTFTYGDFDDPLSAPTNVDILFTVTMTDAPYADQLYLTNQVRAQEGSTNAGTQTDDEIIQIVSSEPLLKIWKGVIATDNPAGTFTPPAIGPVSFSAPGSAGVRWSGTIDSDGLDSTPVDSDAANVDASDLVSFAIVIDNLGSGHRGAHDIRIKDDLPPGFSIPAGGLNLTITRGDGTVLGYVPLGPSSDDSDLFGDGVELVDPAADEGACQAYSLTGGRNIAVLTYDLQLDPDVGPSQVITNTATVFNYASVEGGEDFTGTNSDLTDSADVTIAFPLVDKTILGTNQTFTAGNNVAIGEQVQYQVTVTVPEGEASAVTLVDTLDAGLAFVTLDDLTASPALATDVAGGFAQVLTNAQAALASPGSSATFDFGTLTNSDADNSAPETITLTYTVVVINGGSNDRGDTRTNDAEYTWTVDTTTSSVANSAPLVTIVEPTLQVTKTALPATGDAGDTITFNVTITNGGASNAEAFDVTWSDVIPAGMTYTPGTLAFTGVGVPPSTLVDTAAPTLSATWVSPATSFPVGSDSHLTFDVTLDSSVSPGQVITNTANLAWTSLPGDVTSPQSTFNTLSTERTGDTSNPGGTDNDYRASGPANVTILSGPVKSLASTSEAHTGVVGGTESVAIGEIVRYRLVFQLPEGTATNFQLQDQLPPGLQFLDDDTATAALVSNGGVPPAGGISSSTLPSVDGGGHPLAVAGDQTTIAGITPAYILPDNAVSSSATDSSADAYGSGTDPYFWFGTLTNFDRDTDQEFVVVEFNAVVMNIAGNQAYNNASGAAATTNRDNTFLPRVNGVAGTASSAVRVRIAEPLISNLNKSLSVTPADAGDSLQYTLTFGNASSLFRAAAAFDLRVLDALDANLELTGVVVAAPGYALVTDNSSLVTDTVDVLVSELDPGDSVTITVSAQVIDTVPFGTTIPNTASLTYTSLPGDNGTASNPTGSSTPGTPGGPTGERTGSDGPGGALNDYADTASLDLALADPAVSKSVFATSVTTSGSGQFSPSITDLVIGEEVTFHITVTLPEGDGPVTVTDLLPSPPGGVLNLISSQVLAVGGQISGSALSVGDPGVASDTGSDGLDDQIVFNFGTLHNAPDGVSNSDDQLVMEVVARLENLAANQNGDTLTNQVTLDYGTGSQTDSADVEVVEPDLSISKTADDDTPFLGQTVIYTITVQHSGSSTADAEDIVITDTIPAGLNYVPGSASLPASQVDESGLPTVVFTLPGLTLIDGSASFTYQAVVGTPPSVSVGDTFVNTPDMTWTSISGSDSNERTGVGGVDDYTASTSESVTVTGIDLRITKDDGGITAHPGDVVVYTLHITNVGNTGATGVTISETVPDNTTFSAGSSTAGWSCAGGGVAGSACSFSVPGTLGTSTPVDVDFAVQIVSPAPVGLEQIDNGASVTDDGTHGTEPTPSDNSDTDTTPVDAGPDLSITKDDGLDIVSPGTTLNFQMVVQNVGDQDATGVQVTDTIPDHTTFLPGSSTAGWSCDPDNAAGSLCTFDIGDFASGASLNFTFSVVIDDPLDASVTQILNAVDVADDGTNGPEPTPADNHAEDTDFIVSLPKTDLSKTLVDTNQTFSLGTETAIGEILTYEVVFTLPPGTIDSARLTDVLDRGLAFVTCDSFEASTNLVTASPNSLSAICDAPTVGPEPSSSSDPTDAGRRVVFDMGTVTNGDSANATLTLRYQVVVLDAAVNVRGGALGNHVEWTWDGGSLSETAERVSLIEPTLSLAKTAAPRVVPPGSPVTFTLSIAHTTPSDADAFDLVLTDSLPVDLVYVTELSRVDRRGRGPRQPGPVRRADAASTME